MKAALQEAEEAEGEEGDIKRVRDAKGREILSEEEKAKKEEKDRKKAAEVSSLVPRFFNSHRVSIESGRTKGKGPKIGG